MHREFLIVGLTCRDVGSLSLSVYEYAVVVVSGTYRDDISDGYSIPDEKPTIGYSIPDEILTTCFQLCELV